MGPPQPSGGSAKAGLPLRGAPGPWESRLALAVRAGTGHCRAQPCPGRDYRRRRKQGVPSGNHTRVPPTGAGQTPGPKEQEATGWQQDPRSQTPERELPAAGAQAARRGAAGGRPITSSAELPQGPRVQGQSTSAGGGGRVEADLLWGGYLPQCKVPGAREGPAGEEGRCGLPPSGQQGVGGRRGAARPHRDLSWRDAHAVGPGPRRCPQHPAPPGPRRHRASTSAQTPALDPSSAHVPSSRPSWGSYSPGLHT